MSSALTPMMQQYQGVRRTLPPNTLLMFRLGDFYEMFFEDAQEAAGILNVALTKRNGVPMCGVPYHAAEGYLAKLVKAGKRVAICDQVGEPRPGRIVEREVVQIVSPGTVADLNLLESNRNHFLAAAHRLKQGAATRIGLAHVDLSTGEFRLTELASDAALADEIARISPAELLVSDDAADGFPGLTGLQPHDGYAFLPEHAEFALKEHFRVQSLDGFGCAHLTSALCAAGALLHYLKQLRRQVGHITRLGLYRSDTFVEIDAATQANLELVTSRGARNTSLLAALDRTVTPMGGRRLRDWILHPLRDRATLEGRQQMIADLLAEPFVLSQMREALRSIRDIERTIGRLSQSAGNGRDLQALRVSLEQIPDLQAALEALASHPMLTAREPAPDHLARALAARLHPLPDLVARLAEALVDEPPALLREGGLIRDGFNADLDELRRASTEGKDWIARLQQEEIERTGIKSLKVRYNSVFGYFIEITRANLDSVPGDYTRKQTTVNGERFITPALKEVEAKILGADERARNLEHELFLALRAAVLEHLDALQSTAGAIAEADTLCALAETARMYGYCRPELRDDLVLAIEEGRHPVLDQNLTAEKFVPNDVLLDGGANRLLIITGPNMAGKSTFIRQVALLTLMAQIGSFVPAKSAVIGLADRIFTRVGANDDLSRGQSTFMVEMNETANIVNNATERSLVILDEIGRGTSTFDGLSIAWSVAEFLHDRIRARTLFATHYHELTDLETTRDGVRNYNVAVREWNDQIIFLHKIIPGGADKSYGIQVARLAGLPDELIARAKEILANLEKAELSADGKPALAAHVAGPRKPRTPRPPDDDDPDAPKPQLSFF